MKCGRCTADLRTGQTICPNCGIAFQWAATARIRVSRWQSRRVRRAIVRDLFWALTFGILGLIYSQLTNMPQPLLLTLSIFGVVGGALVAYIPSTLNDILDRRRAEAQLKNQRERFNQMLVHARGVYEKRVEDSANDVAAYNALGVIEYLSGDYPRSAAWLNRVLELQPDDASAANNLGAALDKMGRWMDARESFEKAVQIEDDRSVYQSNLGLIYRKQGNTDAAIHWLEQARQSLQENGSVEPHRTAALLERGEYEQIIHDNQPANAETATASALCATENRSDLDERMHLALARHGVGDTTTALRELEAITRQDRSHARARTNLGLLHYLDRQPVDSILDLRQAHLLDPNCPVTKNDLGLVLYMTGHSDEGLEFLREARETSGEWHDAHYNLGLIALQQGDMETALSSLQRAVEADPKKPDGRINLGAALYLMKKFSEAGNHLLTASYADPRNPVTYLNLSLVYADTGAHAQALEMAGKVLEIQPHSAEARFCIGYACLMQGNAKDAIDQLKIAVTEDPQHLASHWNLGLAYYGFGAFDLAAGEFEWVIKSEPRFGRAHYALACGYLEQERGEGAALRKLLEAMRLEPRNADVYVNLGLLYYKRNQVDRAIDCYSKAAQLRPRNAEDHNNLALAYAKKKELLKAISHFEKSLAIESSNPVTHSNLGLAYYFRNQPVKSMEHWHRVSQLDARYAESREAVRTAQYDDAQMGFKPLDWQQRAIKIAPSTADPRFKFAYGYQEDWWSLETGDETLREAYQLHQEITRLERSVRHHQLGL